MAGDPILASDGPGYRDTASGLGRLLPTPEPDCTRDICRERHRMLHLLADDADKRRDYIDRITADLAAAARRLAAFEARNQGDTR